MADSQVSNFAPEYASLVPYVTQGALEAYQRPASAAIPAINPQQQGALNWTGTLTNRPIDTTPARNMVYQSQAPTSRVATGAFDTAAGLRAANPYDDLVRGRALADFDEQASTARARRAAQSVGNKSLGTKSSLANAAFDRDTDRQRGDLNSQLLQRGFETGRAQYNTDQGRALQASMSNQQASARDRQMALQGAGALQGLDNYERSAMTQNIGALQGAGSMIAGRDQAMTNYPWQQVNNLNSILQRSGSQTTQGDAPWWQTGAALAGTAATAATALANSGAFGASGWMTGANGWFADGGEIDDDEPRGAFAFDYNEDDDPVIDAEWMEIPADESPDDEQMMTADEGQDVMIGGGDDPMTQEPSGYQIGALGLSQPAETGMEAPVMDGALMTGSPMGALGPAQPAMGALASRLPNSGYTQAHLAQAQAEMDPRARPTNRIAQGTDALAALLLGIGGANTRDFGRAVAAGGQGLAAQQAVAKKEQMLNEAARQKAAGVKAKMISDAIGKDRDLQGRGMIADAGNEASMAREIARLEAQEKQGGLNRENQEKLARLRSQATLQAAGIAANATLGSARLREGAPTAVQKDAIAAGLKPGTPEYNQFIMQSYAGNGMTVKSDGKGGFELVQGKGVGSLGNKAQGEVETDLLDATRDLMSLSQIRSKFDPKFLQIPEKAMMEGANMADKFGMNLSPDRANDMDRYYSFRAEVGDRTTRIRNQLFGAALTVPEQKSAEEFLPTNNDGPKQFESKLKRTEDTATKAVARLNYIRKNGMSMNEVPLDKMPTIMNDRGAQIMAELKGGGMDAEKAKAEAKRRIAREFGLVGD